VDPLTRGGCQGTTSEGDRNGDTASCGEDGIGEVRWPAPSEPPDLAERTLSLLSQPRPNGASTAIVLSEIALRFVNFIPDSSSGAVEMTRAPVSWRPS
jgi:hypothetical protein